MHIEVDNHATDKLQDMEFNNYITLCMALNMIKKQTMSCRFFLSRRATLKHTGYSVPMSRGRLEHNKTDSHYIKASQSSLYVRSQIPNIPLLLLPSFVLKQQLFYDESA